MNCDVREFHFDFLAYSMFVEDHITHKALVRCPRFRHMGNISGFSVCVRVRVCVLSCQINSEHYEQDP